MQASAILEKRREIASAQWDLQFFWRASIMLAIYVIVGRLSYNFAIGHGFVPLIWPPSGIALAAVALGGYRYAPVAALGSLVVNIMVHEPFGIALGDAMAVGVSMALGRLLLEGWHFDPLLRRLQDTLAIVFAAVLVGLAVSVITALILFTGHYITAGAGFDRIWTTRWISDALGMLVIAPFIVRWLPHPRFRVQRTSSELLEFFGSIVTLTFLSILAYWTPFTSLGPLPVLYLTLIPLTWIALRVGPRGMTLAIFLNSVIAISGALFSNVPSSFSATSLLPLQILLGTLSVLTLVLIGVEEERKDGRRILQRHVQELQEALERIDLEDKSKNEFIAILAHELRNPLAPVLSALEFLKFQEPDTETRVKMVGGAIEQIQVMRRLLDDLLDVARITQKKFKLQREAVTLTQAIDQSIRMVEPFMQTRRHSFTVSLPEQPLWLHADAARLTQIFANILFNSAKYTNPGGRIELCAQKRDDSAIISVVDNGMGIQKDRLESIFEPFVQYQQHSSMVGTGLGLGLALTKRLVEMHGGSIEAQSEGTGKGSRFVVTLPLSRSVNTLRIPLEDSPPHRTAAQMKILIVDDNEPAAEGLSKLLHLHRGHAVEVAFTAKDALEKVESFDPQVIILDIGLPDIDGYEVARRLRQEKGYTQKLIALTGFGQENDKRKAIEAGFNHHLTKPVGLADIERLLERSLDTHRQKAPEREAMMS